MPSKIVIGNVLSNPFVNDGKVFVRKIQVWNMENTEMYSFESSQ
jgi:hypothetical protein